MKAALRKVMIAGGLVGLGLLIVWGFMPQPPLVDVARATRGPLRVSIEEEARTRVQDRYVVSAPVPGYQHRIELEVGDPVTAGQVLAVLEPLRSVGLDPRARAEAQARVAASEAALQQAEAESRVAAADASLADATLERTQKLFEAGSVGREVLDQADARSRMASAARRSGEFAVQVARYQLEAARASLAYTAAEAPGADAERVEVRSPVAGRVLRLLHESEGAVAGGQPLVEVGDPAALEVVAEVLSSDAVLLSQGTRTLLERWGGDKPLEARVRRVEPVGFTKVSALGVEEQRVLVVVELVSPPAEWQRLGDGYRVEAVFVLWEEASVLQVPESALWRTKEGQWAAFVLDAEGRARQRELSIGRKNGLEAQVLAGIEEGETVIVHPPGDITDGGDVRVR